MSVGLIALLDDIAALAKMAATTIDDVAAQATKAGSKAAAVVIDDAAVTPKYVVGINPNRELPVIGQIALASLKNKLLILLPIALALSFLAPWLITPLLMIGGAYLCYEGTEKLYETFFPHKAHHHEKVVNNHPLTPQELEKATVLNAVRTDFILSAEIVAISLAAVTETPILTQVLVLILISFTITFGVYGVVALIVKADDIGLALASDRNQKAKGFRGVLALIGKAIVKGMPKFLKLLSWVGTIAMLWVGGSIIVHGLAIFGLDFIEHFIHHMGELVAHSVTIFSGLWAWIVMTLFQGLIGILVGALSLPVVEKMIAPMTFKFTEMVKRKN